MAYRRRRRYTRKSYRKRVYARRNYRKRPMPVVMRRRRIPRKYNKNIVVKVKRCVVGNALNGPTVVGVTASATQTYKLSDISANIRYDTMYDKYRISGIKLKFYPPVSEMTFPTQDPGFFYYQCDTDDSSVPPFVDFTNRSNIHKRRLVGKPFSYFFRPKYASSAYEGGVATPAVQANGDEWLDSAYPGIQHYSFKYHWISYNLLNAVMTYDLTYYLEFKDLVSQNG